MNELEFYRECARLLGCSHDGEAFPYPYRTRWNNRKAGRGRFEGHGIIRIFGDRVHVALHRPEISVIASQEEVLALLKQSAIIQP